MWWSVARRLGTVVVDALAPARCAGCAQSDSVLCPACVEAVTVAPPPVLRGARAAFAYRDEVRSIVHRGKFRDARAALRALAWVGAARLDPPPGAVVAPVPLAARRATERGYNQAEVVASAFATFHRLPLRALLVRSRDTPAQSTLTRPARAANVAGAFRAVSGVAGTTVWLVDDVLTTGATTASARATLLAAGAARVDVAVLAAVL